MFKNYLKLAWRNLLRNKLFTIINLFGLCIGMTCSILIFLWVYDELSYDKFHHNYGDIYQVMVNREFKNQVFTENGMVFPLAESLETGLPQIRKAVKMGGNAGEYVLSYKDTKLLKKGYVVGKHFFDIFSFTFLKGNVTTAISDPNSIVLTQSTAISLFGNKDPVNKTIEIDNSTPMKVSAVIDDPPDNSSFKFDFIRTFNYARPGLVKAMEDWESAGISVYLLTTPGANITLLNKTINDIMRFHNPAEKVSTYFTFPMSKLRLYSDFKDGKKIGGMIEYVRLFGFIAIIILFIACINFMNLSTARSEKRAKEVGIRKTLGSGKSQLMLQFLFESIIFTVFSFVFSIILVYLLLEPFNTLVDKKLDLHIGNPILWIGILFIILFTGIVAGSYPALYLSSFNPVRVLKGTILIGRNAVLPRRILIVFQFMISIFLLSGTIIVYQQLKYIKTRDLGYNPNNLIMLPTSRELNKNFSALKQDLLNTRMIDAVTRTSCRITEICDRSNSPDWESKPVGLDILFTNLNSDVDFPKTMGVKLREGKEFSGKPSDITAVLLNKSAVDAMQLKNPIGRLLRYGQSTYTVIGVTDNMVIETPYKPVDPMIIYYDPKGSNVITVRLNRSVSPQKALINLGSLFKKYDPALYFEYHFVDEEFGKKFLTEELISKITNIFACLAILICGIGLAGVATFTIEKRLKEISIRKVLGASLQQILSLISKEFLKLVLLAFVIGVPLTWLGLNSWLEKYTFHVNINMWLFFEVGAFLLIITFAIVSLNTLSGAMRNPIKSLRTE
jgi:putative ABC transport system permease protein